MNWGRHRTKFNNRRTEAFGKTFSSGLEASVYCLLRLREKASEIHSITCQERTYLTRAKILYIADFMFFDAKLGNYVRAEAKGMELSRFKIIKQLWPYYGNGPLEIWKGTAQKPVLTETLVPLVDS